MKNLKFPFFPGLLSITTVCLSVSAFAMGSFQGDSSQIDPSSTGSSWRLTKYGWQDSSAWYADNFAPNRNLELIHPVILAVLVLILVITALVWASSEWEIAQLLQKHTETGDEPGNSDSVLESRSPASAKNNREG